MEAHDEMIATPIFNKCFSETLSTAFNEAPYSAHQKETSF